MPLITRNECGNQVSGTAKACPQCGAKGKALTGPKKLGTLGKVMFGIFGVSIVIAGATNMNPPSRRRRSSKPRPLSPRSKM